MKLFPHSGSVETPDLQITPPAWLSEFVEDFQPDSQFGQRLAGMQVVLSTAEACMEFAIQLSAQNVKHGTGGPFGSGLFAHDADSGTYTLLAPGVNRVVPNHASRGHGENMALEAASRKLGTPNLKTSAASLLGQKIILFTSGETCAQCMDHACACHVDAVYCAASGDDIERLTGFWEGVKPTDWREQLRARGVETGTILCERALPVLEEYARVGFVYNASAANRAEGISLREPKSLLFNPRFSIQVPDWIHEYLISWKSRRHFFSQGGTQRVLSETEIQYLFSLPEARMAFVNELAAEATKHDLPPLAAALFYRTPGQDNAYDLVAVGLHLVQAENSASLTAPVVAFSQAERLGENFALPPDQEPVMTCNVICGYDLGALSWAGPTRIEYGVSMDQVPGTHPLHQILNAGLNTPKAYSAAMAELQLQGRLADDQIIPLVEQVGESETWALLKNYFGKNV